MNPPGLDLPDNVLAQQLMQQNAHVAEQANRAGAVQIAASIATPGTPIGTVLENARTIEHYVRTGQVARGALRAVDD